MRLAFSRFSRIKSTAVDDLVLVPFLMSNFLNDLVNGRSRLQIWDRQLVIGRHNFGESFGFWVDRDVIPGSSLKKGSRIFAFRRRGKKPTEAFRKQRRCVKQWTYSLTAHVNRSSRCSISFFVIAGVIAGGSDKPVLTNDVVIKYTHSRAFMLDPPRLLLLPF